jgi:hypothetical protein
MAKSPQQPPLTVVSSETIRISPPRPLGSHGMALWGRVQGEYAIADVGGVELLTQICTVLDRVEALAEGIQRDGSIVYSRAGVPRAHPALREELAGRAFIARSLERLGIGLEGVKPVGHPPAQYGWTGDR